MRMVLGGPNSIMVMYMDPLGTSSESSCFPRGVSEDFEPVYSVIADPEPYSLNRKTLI